MSEEPLLEGYDIIVVGGGNAGFSAASTAAESGAKVLLLEKAPESDSGGNTFYTAGAYRYCFDGLGDLQPILYQEDGTKDLPDDLMQRIEMQPYTEADFLGDLRRVTKDQIDLNLAKVLVKNSREAVQWIADNGGKWHLSFHRQAYEVDGKFKFWGGMVTAFLGGGKALIDWHLELAHKRGVNVHFECPVVGLMVREDSTTVYGVEVIHKGVKTQITARHGVILACGGFQADDRLRSEWLGSGWELARVRGCRHSTGDGHQLAMGVGARRAGHFAGCHSTCWDADSPRDGGNRALTNQYTKSGYPLGIMLNIDGKRFVDEGLDLRNYTYAIFGAEILKQPMGIALQIWDAEGSQWLRKEEYADDVTRNIRGESLTELAEKLESHGLRDKQQFLDTIQEFNGAAEQFIQENPDSRFDPASKDGMSTQSAGKKLALAKSNWARPLTKPPFTCVKVTCGITFTFGGLDVVPETAQVISETTKTSIPGLYCCGELLGLFHHNYPGGSGLTAGTVFGRIAGAHAARRCGDKGKPV